MAPSQREVEGLVEEARHVHQRIRTDGQFGTVKAQLVAEADDATLYLQDTSSLDAFLQSQAESHPALFTLAPLVKVQAVLHRLGSYLATASATAADEALRQCAWLFPLYQELFSTADVSIWQDIANTPQGAYLDEKPTDFAVSWAVARWQALIQPWFETAALRFSHTLYCGNDARSLAQQIHDWSACFPCQWGQIRLYAWPGPRSECYLRLLQLCKDASGYKVREQAEAFLEASHAFRSSEAAARRKVTVEWAEEIRASHRDTAARFVAADLIAPRSFRGPRAAPSNREESARRTVIALANDYKSSGWLVENEGPIKTVLDL